MQKCHRLVEKIKQTQAEVRFSTSLSSLKLTTVSARLQQVLINLLINATKFTAQGTITLELVKQTEDTALFSVSDTGLRNLQGEPEQDIQPLRKAR